MPIKKIIHINQFVIKANRKNGETNPPITVKTYKANHYASRVSIDGPSTLVYSPEKPLACGAHVWLETTADVRVYLDGTDKPFLV